MVIKMDRRVLTGPLDNDVKTHKGSTSAMVIATLAAINVLKERRRRRFVEVDDNLCMSWQENDVDSSGQYQGRGREGHVRVGEVVFHDYVRDTMQS
jgi:hypothetical protein